MSAVVDSLRRTLPAHQVITDDLRRLAYGSDASFYRLIPQVIVRPRDLSHRGDRR